MTSASPVVLPAEAPETIREAVRTLRDGGVVAVPTDTVFGLVAQFDNEEAIRRIFEIKRRPPAKPLPLLLSTASELPLVVTEVPAFAWPLVQAFWPGPLTIIFKSLSVVSSLISAGSGTVGCRVPAHRTTLEILEALGYPVASTSANLSSQPPAATAVEVVQQLGASVDLVVDTGEEMVAGEASTVVDLTTNPVLIRRRGAITPARLREVLTARIELAPEGEMSAQ